MIRILLAVVVFAALGFWLDTRQNQFPFYYHPDEIKKVDQILSGERNFNHPLLMLNVVETTWKLVGKPTDRQKIVEIGRTSSAVFCVLGTLAFMLAAWTWRGPLAGVATGAWLTCHQQVFELAHYFKEDPALYAGVGLFTWAAIAYFRKPNQTRLIALGLSLGWAASAKYLGLILIIPAFILLWQHPKKAKEIGLFLAIFLGSFLLINLPIFSRLDIFETSFSKEINWVVTGEKDVTRSVPHSLYLNIFVENTSPLLWILLIALVLQTVRQKPADRFLTWLFLGTFLGWLVLLSFSPKTNDRYFLPLTGLVLFLTASALPNIVLKPKWRWLPYAFLVGVLLLEIPKTRQYDTAFVTDDRAELVTWIQQNIPPDQTIGYETKVNLPDIEVYHELTNPLPHRLLRKFFVADLGTPDYFAQEKIAYLIITESTYGRFFLDSLKPKTGEAAEFNRRANFYQKLRLQTPLWSRPRSTVLYLHPGLEVYRYEKKY